MKQEKDDEAGEQAPESERAKASKGLVLRVGDVVVGEDKNKTGARDEKH